MRVLVKRTGSTTFVTSKEAEKAKGKHGLPEHLTENLAPAEKLVASAGGALKRNDVNTNYAAWP
ncbi:MULTISPECIES: hypothetical protein [Ensifer]|uniref:hypothetical protein n=1 Tax=Ensifer TaxID=106591 RepID=UPI000DE0AAF6|nr:MULTISPECIES: hypothetical protein [Ensifer]MBD9498348.1 hypothetical protein [Ensifer sp. ENS01]MCY1745674.1 hypothetical protein [Ensifer sp. SL37]QHG73895.1 hypothetical protein DQW09_28800 [Ensifer adhaerens]